MTFPPQDHAPKRDIPSFLPAFGTWLEEGAILPDWLSRAHMARGGTPASPPSFAAHMDSAVRLGRFQEKICKITPVSRLLRRREWARDWLADQGWHSPGLLAGPFALQDIAQHLEGLDSGVIKPVHATNAWGVMPFRRTGPFEFRNLFDGQVYRMSHLLELLHAPMQRYMFPNKWQIEALVSPPGGPDHVPDDFKVYALGGHAPLILQVRRSLAGNRYKFYDADWQPVQTGKYPDTTDIDLPLPQDPQAMTDLACAISAALPLPFCRIDLFEGAEGLIVGELTPEPGGYQNFSPAADLYLGAYYELAQAYSQGAGDV